MGASRRRRAWPMPSGARDIIGDKPFAILLPDEFKKGVPVQGCMRHMVDAYYKIGGNLLCALGIPMDQTPSYGVIDPGGCDGALTEVEGLGEKPKLGTAPSKLILSGRYILQPDIIRCWK